MAELVEVVQTDILTMTFLTFLTFRGKYWYYKVDLGVEWNFSQNYILLRTPLTFGDLDDVSKIHCFAESAKLPVFLPNTYKQ